ncbi:hypothetical protein FQA39_LY15067 [Lamprigera yunnana]|nr:hypothetical protein FQA39_LY15067 [Lamprigera yunnana]
MQIIIQRRSTTFIQNLVHFKMAYAEIRWTKAVDLRTAVERLHDQFSALEFYAEHEAVYGLEKCYSDIECSELQVKYEMGVKLCDKFLQDSMSTLPGLASKGEKGKSKFQSLDINNLYKVYTTEPLETQQQKNTLPRKHGMQSLGKVPTARRPPANLPSLKSEHTGSDAAVSLVPSGGAGWGKQDQNSPSTNISGSISTTTNSNVTTSSSPANVQPTAPTTNAAPITSLPPPNKTHTIPIATPVTADKSWSSVMSGADFLQPPPYQSPQFQHEFPSLSAGDGVPPRTGADTQYGPGPSLRPQTEGSWIQGGSRSGTEVASKSNSVALAPQPQLSGPVGQNQQSPPQPAPPQFRGLIPQFMFRGSNYPSNGHGNPNFSNNSGSVNNGRNRMSDNRGLNRTTEGDEVCHRPIIKEEDLNRMDDMTRDVGWASHDDIDYNQKLAFSDDEGEVDKIRRQSTYKDQDKIDITLQEANTKNSPKLGSNAHLQANRSRSNEEDEVWVQRRRQQSEEVAIVIERAKQRKEEEEKRFLVMKQAAAKKLQLLDEKSKSKHDKELDDNQGTINPSVVPPQPINPVPIPVPDWEKEKERSRTPVENKSQYRENASASEFRKMAQIDGRNFVRKETRSAERDSRERERDAPSFSKQFQSNLPPRFQKRHQMRNNPSPQPSQSGPQSYLDQSDTRWQNQSKSLNDARKRDAEDENKEQDDNLRDVGKTPTDDSYRTSYRSFVDITHKIDEDCEFEYTKNSILDEHTISRQNSDDSRLERFERPQRPDSRDSRASRESRHSRESESRDYHSSWADVPFDSGFDEKRKDHFREDRRAVLGLITKERIEAEDLKSEKNLTQLKRGYIPEKRNSDLKKDEEKVENIWEDSKMNEKHDKDETNSLDVWTDTILNSIPETNPFLEDKPKLDFNKEDKQDDDLEKTDKVPEKDKEDKRNMTSNRRRGEQHRHQQPWANACIYRSSWLKKSDMRRGGSRNGALKKPTMGKNNEWHGTDSDVSIDEMSISTENGKDDQSMKASSKKFEKDEKNKEVKQEKFGNGDRKLDSNRRDSYVPRGEPSRHGRGASNFRSRVGLSKRIDGYGPPPSKSPFSQLEDKDKKVQSDDGVVQGIPADDTIPEDQINPNQTFSTSTSVVDKEFGLKVVDDRSDANKIKNDENSNDNCDMSDNSEDNGPKSRRFNQKTVSGINRSLSAVNANRRNNPAPRFTNDKRTNYSTGGRQSSNISLKTYLNKKEKEEVKDCSNKKESMEDLENIENKIEGSTICDSDGFQEVKSKKTGLRQKPFDEKLMCRSTSKTEKDRITNKKTTSAQLTPLQIANIPSLMDTPINPPALVSQINNNKNQFDRSRQNKLPPRFARQRESRLQKAHMQQSMCDVNELGKVNHNINMYGIKDSQGSSGGRISNAWDKPLSTHLRTEQMLSVCIDTSKTLEQPQQTSQDNSPNIDKVMKPAHGSEKTVLDGATPPVNTIIFENTNFKTTPGVRSNRSEKSCPSKLEENGMEQAAISSFNKPMRDLLNKNEKPSDPMQIQLSFGKEDSADMKLDFFESELSHLTEDKSSKNMGLSRSMHITNANNTISASTADALNFKIASVKKVWETMPTVIEHSVGQEDTNSSFSASFGADPNSLDSSNAFGKSGDTPEDTLEVYSSATNQPTSNNTTNVCKVKPTQQVTGTSGQPVHSASVHQQHTTAIGPGIVGHPLSPPPMQPVLGTGVGLGQPPQPYTSNQHLGYQPNLGGNTQYGMSAIPSPPTVLFNSTQQIQAAQTGLYGAFQIDQSQVLGGQGRSQYSPYANPYNLGQTASSPYSAQSMYLQGAQPHPSAAQAPPDIYQNLNNYRIPATGPFGQNQQLNNPTTVLISSTSNSLMSATVKPSSQPISAIGTKASSTGQAYQQQSQQGQLYMAYDPTIQANYLPNTGVLQRGPTAPIQNNVVPGLQPSSSYYTGSTGAQTGFFQQPASSTLQSASLQQHQAGYGLQGNVFGNPNQSHSNATLQNFGSHFLSSPMQLAAALNAQQFRSTNLQSSAYVKSTNNHIGDQNSRPQQIKSPGSQQDVLSSVFNSGSQIPSPKSRQNMKQPPPQASPTTQHKYLYQPIGNASIAQNQRYPPPIQRPVTFHSTVGAIPNNSGPSNNPKHRTSNQSNKLSGRNYYSSQGANLSSTQTDKGDDSKLGDSATSNSSNSIVTNASNIVSKTVNTNSSSTISNQSPEIANEATKDDTSVIKD